MSQLPTLLAVSYFCGWTFELRLTVKRWWMRLQSVWVTGHERLHHHSLDNSFLPLPSKNKRKKEKKRQKECVGDAASWQAKCKAGCVQVGGWTAAPSVVCVPVTVNCWKKCAALRNKVLRFGSALTLSLVENKHVTYAHICSAKVQLLGIKSILRRVQVWLAEKHELKSSRKPSHLQFSTCLTCAGFVWVFGSCFPAHKGAGDGVRTGKVAILLQG